MSFNVKKDQQIHVAPIDVDEWMRRNFDDGDGFTDALTVRVAFRTIGSRKQEHVVNKLAAMVTARQSDIFPGGRLCHCEIIIPVRDSKYFKASVIKKSYAGKDDKGAIKWKAGGVHCKWTTSHDWAQKYVFLKLHAQRPDIKRMLEWALRQDSAPFSHISYYSCVIVPGGIGPRCWDPALEKRKVPMFCTQFCTLLLQLLAREDGSYDDNHWRRRIHEMNAATSSPNSVYRLLVNSTGVYGDSALGAVIAV